MIFQRREPGQRHSIWLYGLVVLCAALLLCASTVQVTHVHADARVQDHCPICVAIHSAMPADASNTLVSFLASHPQAAASSPQIAYSGFCEYSLANRPPPAPVTI